MNTKLYHADLGIPSGLCLWSGQPWKLEFTRHALQALLTDRYGLPKRVPKSVCFADANVFEVAVNGIVTTKVCVRIQDHESCFEGPRPNMDLCLVLIRSHQIGVLTVLTCWFNLREDTHSTLDASKYSRP